MQWRRILNGEDAQGARKTAQHLAHKLVEALPNEENQSLAGGAAGILVALDYASRVVELPPIDWTVPLERAVDSLESKAHFMGLHAGISGILWSVEHVCRQQAIEFSIDLSDAVDVICDYVSDRGWEPNYDLINGGIGIGVFLLNHANDARCQQAVGTILESLEQLRRPAEPGYSWWTPPDLLPAWQRQLRPDGYYNLGMAHGIPGVISFLSRCVVQGWRADLARSLLRPAVEWLMSCAGDAPHARYAAWLGDRTPARNAWCYGDAGVALALTNAAISLEDSAVFKFSRELSLLAARRPIADCGAFDHSVCHGSAGNAHAFARLHQTHRDAELGEAAVAWAALITQGEAIVSGQPLTYKLSKAEANGFTSYFGPSNAFLVGDAGVLAALCALISDEPPHWDAALLCGVE